MFKGIKVFLLLILAAPEIIISQQLSHQVLVPAAGVMSSGSINYSQTIGETAIEVIGSSGYIFTQGFQQPTIKPSDKIVQQGNGVEVYPNPARDFVYIELFGDVARKFKIDLINITGTTISSVRINFSDPFHFTQSIDINRLLRGMYFVRIVSDDKLIYRTFKIEKI